MTAADGIAGKTVTITGVPDPLARSWPTTWSKGSRG